jgi:hypothetical protein
MRMEKIIVALLLLGTPVVSFADTTNALPEPETLALFAGAGFAWAIVRWLRRK